MVKMDDDAVLSYLEKSSLPFRDYILIQFLLSKMDNIPFF